MLKRDLLKKNKFNHNLICNTYMMMKRKKTNVVLLKLDMMMIIPKTKKVKKNMIMNKEIKNPHTSFLYVDFFIILKLFIFSKFLFLIVLWLTIISRIFIYIFTARKNLYWSRLRITTRYWVSINLLWVEKQRLIHCICFCIFFCIHFLFCLF